MKACVVAVLLVAWPSGRAAAQLAIHVSAGARYSGALAHDSIVVPFDVQPSVAPAFSAGVELPPHRRWSGGARIDASLGQLRRIERNTTSDLGGLTALSFTVHLRREIVSGLGAQITAGGLRYFAADEAGMFRGGGEFFPLLGIAADWAPSVFRNRGLALEARADVHRFLTQAMRSQGFTEHRLVPRASLALRADLGKLW